MQVIIEEGSKRSFKPKQYSLQITLKIQLKDLKAKDSNKCNKNTKR